MFCTHSGRQAMPVSIKSGLEGRNNAPSRQNWKISGRVSMKSGLEGRNNLDESHRVKSCSSVSMKSGLEGRNNGGFFTTSS